MLTLVLGDQDKDGAWRLAYVWEPHGSTPDVMTAWALALTAPNCAGPRTRGPGGKGEGNQVARGRGPGRHPAGGRPPPGAGEAARPPAGRWEPLRKRLLARQNADGGWGQAAGLRSDAFATGQALVAVAAAGCVPGRPGGGQGPGVPGPVPAGGRVLGNGVAAGGRAGRAQEPGPHHPRRDGLGGSGAGPLGTPQRQARGAGPAPAEVTADAAPRCEPIGDLAAAPVHFTAPALSRTAGTDSEWWRGRERAAEPGGAPGTGRDIGYAGGESPGGPGR